MVAAISPRQMPSQILIDSVDGINQSVQTRQVGNSQPLDPLASYRRNVDAYMKASPAAKLFYNGIQERTMGQALFTKPNLPNTSFLNVRLDDTGDLEPVEVTHTQLRYLPSEERTIEVIEEIMPSVAYISVTGKYEDESGKKQVGRWLGSGFAIDPKDLDLPGYEPEPGQTLIATNHHVANDSMWIETELKDGRVFSGPANVLISDEDMDIAILIIDTGKEYIPPVPIGTEDDIGQGEQVLAFGQPKGLPFRVTSGIINNSDFNEEGVIQTEAAINPGNSGGPLVDLSSGNVIGMNTFKFVGEEIDSMGFAMPIWLQFETLRDIWEKKYMMWNVS